VLWPAAVVDGWQAEGPAVAVAKEWGKGKGKGRGPAVANAAAEVAARAAGEAVETPHVEGEQPKRAYSPAWGARPRPFGWTLLRRLTE